MGTPVSLFDFALRHIKAAALGADVAARYGGLVSERHIATIEVHGRPATFATASEGAWKAAVRAAVGAAGCEPIENARFAVRLDFRVADPRTAAEVWDLDNLIKPTLDAMEGIFGLRQWKGRPQPADDRVDRIEAQKRKVSVGERAGATIDVWVIESGPEPSDP